MTRNPPAVAFLPPLRPHPVRVSRVGRWADSVGSIGAIVCALHCALLPFLLAALPALGLSMLLSTELEVGYVAFATLLALTSLWRGYRLHRVGRALAVLGPGLVAVWCGLGVPALHESIVAHAVTMAIGGSLIAIAHLVNLRLTRVHVHGACCAHPH